MPVANDSADLFRHVSAEKAAFYRCIMDVFAAAKRQYRLQLRPDEVLAEARWPERAPRIEEVQCRADASSPPGAISNRSRTRRASRPSATSIAPAFSTGCRTAAKRWNRRWRSSCRRCSTAPNCRRSRWKTSPAGCRRCRRWPARREPDVAKVHETLRDLVRVFESLAENAQAFMAGVARSIELQQAEAGAVAGYKRRLIDYLERFMGDLVRRSDAHRPPDPGAGGRASTRCCAQVAEREARDAAPGDAQEQADATRLRWQAWRERWKGLRGWFLRTGHEPPQAELLRARARSAIPQLLGAIAALNERRSGRSDRSADFRMLAGWFADCADDAEAHRLARAAFALNPARHFSLNTDADAELPASTRWADAPPLQDPSAPARIWRGGAARAAGRGCATAARPARCLALQLRRRIAAGRGRAPSASPPAGRRGCPSSASSTCMPSACSSAARRSAGRADRAGCHRRTPHRRRPAAHPAGAAGRRQPRQHRHAARRVCGPRSSDHHHANPWKAR